MSQPSCSEKLTTRSGKLLDKTASKVFKTPLKDNIKSPTSNTHDTPSEKGNICKICQNAIKLRNSLLESNVDSLIGKLNAASETFSDSMSQVENLGLSIRQGTTDINDKWNTINTSINTNRNQLKVISDSIDYFKNDSKAVLSPYIEKISEKIAEFDKIINETSTLPRISDCRLQNPSLNIENSVPAINHNSSFTLGPNNARIIHNIDRLPTNPTIKLSDYTEDFLPDDLRSSVCQFLEEYTAFTDKGSYKSASFGQESNKSKNVIPKPMLEVMNLIHDKYSVANMNHINSIHVSKFVGQSSHREQQNGYIPYLSPDSDIYNIFLGDSSTITFIDNCTNEESQHNACDNIIYTTSVKSQHYWSYGIDRPSSTDCSVTYYLSFRCTHKSYQNSTIIIGDSNTHNISFHNNNVTTKSDLGRDIYGKIVKAFIID